MKQGSPIFALTCADWQDIDSGQIRRSVSALPNGNAICTFTSSVILLCEKMHWNTKRITTETCAQRAESVTATRQHRRQSPNNTDVRTAPYAGL